MSAVIYDFPVCISSGLYRTPVDRYATTQDMEPFFDTVEGRLKYARAQAGYGSAADAARALNLPYSSYAAHENGGTGIPVDKLERYAKKYRVAFEWLATGNGVMALTGGAAQKPAEDGLVVVGKVQAGFWLDTSMVDEDPEPRHIPVTTDPRFRNVRQYALEVAGSSMNEIVDDGSFVSCIDFAESGLDLRSGQIVHVERLRDDGQLVETTLKQVERRGKKWVLIPRSTDPKWQPIELDDGEVVVRGIVTGAFIPIALP